MYCPKCGVKLTEKAVFCHACGTKLPKEIIDSEYKSEVYDSLLVQSAEEQTPEKAPDFFRFTIADKESSFEEDIRFSLPDDLEPLGTTTSTTVYDDREYPEDDINFIIPENRDK